MEAQSTMTTAQVANRLVELCRTGQMDNAVNELYADNIVSIEPEGYQGGPARMEGIAAKRQKSEMWNNMVEEFHSAEFSDPQVAANYFSLSAKMDVTYKGMGRNTMEEICVYGVDNGKIVSEQFFFPTQQ